MNQEIGKTVASPTGGAFPNIYRQPSPDASGLPPGIHAKHSMTSFGEGISSNQVNEKSQKESKNVLMTTMGTSNHYQSPARIDRNVGQYGLYEGEIQKPQTAGNNMSHYKGRQAAIKKNQRQLAHSQNREAPNRGVRKHTENANISSAEVVISTPSNAMRLTRGSMGFDPSKLSNQDQQSARHGGLNFQFQGGTNMESDAGLFRVQEFTPGDEHSAPRLQQSKSNCFNSSVSLGQHIPSEPAAMMSRTQQNFMGNAQKKYKMQAANSGHKLLGHGPFQMSQPNLSKRNSKPLTQSQDFRNMKKKQGLIFLQREERPTVLQSSNPDLKRLVNTRPSNLGSGFSDPGEEDLNQDMQQKQYYDLKMNQAHYPKKVPSYLSHRGGEYKSTDKSYYKQRSRQPNSRRKRCGQKAGLLSPDSQGLFNTAENLKEEGLIYSQRGSNPQYIRLGRQHEGSLENDHGQMNFQQRLDSRNQKKGLSQSGQNFSPQQAISGSMNVRRSNKLRGLPFGADSNPKLMTQRLPIDGGSDDQPEENLERLKNKLKDIKRGQHKQTSGSYTNRGTFVPPIDSRFGNLKGKQGGNLKKLKNSDIFKDTDGEAELDMTGRRPLPLGAPSKLSMKRPEDINVLLNSKSNSLELEKDLKQDQYHLSYRNNSNLLQNRSEVNPQKGHQFGILKNSHAKGEHLNSMRIQDEASQMPPQLTEELPSTVDQPTSENRIEKVEDIAMSFKSEENGMNHHPTSSKEDTAPREGSQEANTFEDQEVTGEYEHLNPDCFNVEQDFYYDSSMEPHLASKKMSHRTGKAKIYSSFAVQLPKKLSKKMEKSILTKRSIYISPFNGQQTTMSNQGNGTQRSKEMRTRHVGQQQNQFCSQSQNTLLSRFEGTEPLRFRKPMSAEKRRPHAKGTGTAGDREADNAMLSVVDNLKNVNLEARSTNDDDNVGEHSNQLFDLNLQLEDIDGPGGQGSGTQVSQMSSDLFYSQILSQYNSNLRKLRKKDLIMLLRLANQQMNKLHQKIYDMEHNRNYIILPTNKKKPRSSSNNKAEVFSSEQEIKQEDEPGKMDYKDTCIKDHAELVSQLSYATKFNQEVLSAQYQDQLKTKDLQLKQFYDKMNSQKEQYESEINILKHHNQSLKDRLMIQLVKNRQLKGSQGGTISLNQTQRSVSLQDSLQKSTTKSMPQGESLSQNIEQPSLNQGTAFRSQQQFNNEEEYQPGGYGEEKEATPCTESFNQQQISSAAQLTGEPSRNLKEGSAATTGNLNQNGKSYPTSQKPSVLENQYTPQIQEIMEEEETNPAGESIDIMIKTGNYDYVYGSEAHNHIEVLDEARVRSGAEEMEFQEGEQDGYQQEVFEEEEPNLIEQRELERLQQQQQQMIQDGIGQTDDEDPPGILMPDDTEDELGGEAVNFTGERDGTASLPQDESGFHNQTNMNLQENQAYVGFSGKETSFEEPGIPYLKGTTHIQENSFEVNLRPEAPDDEEDVGYQEQPSISPQAIKQESEYPGEGELSATTKKSKQMSGFISYSGALSLKKKSPPTKENKEDESETDNQRTDPQIEKPQSYRAYHSASSPPLEDDKRGSDAMYDSPSRQFPVGQNAGTQGETYKTSEKLVQQLEEANVLLSSEGKDIFEDLRD